MARVSASLPAEPQLHELESDGEDEQGAGDGSPELEPGLGGEEEDEEEEVDIDDDDVDHELSARMAAAMPASPSPAERRAAAAAAAATARRIAGAGSKAALNDLPAYRSFMQTLQPSGVRPPAASASGRLSLSPSALSSDPSHERDEDEQLGFLQDEKPRAADAPADDDETDPPLTASFESILNDAVHLETLGRTRRAAHLYLLCLERHRYAHSGGGAHQHLVASVLKRLGDMCYRQKKFREALQFRAAERMLFEASLLQVVQSDASRAGTEEEKDADTEAAASNHTGADAASSPRSAAATAAASARALLSSASVDPTAAVARTPLAPASLLADEERALRFERLARVFFDEKNVGMARSYALKAIELRRQIKDKYGDPATLTPAQLQLRQLAVLGQEQYEDTLRRFRGEQPSLGLAPAGASNAQAGSADAAARTMAMHSSMRQALYALSSGELEALSVAPAAAASAAAHATSAASSSGLRPAGSSVAAWRAAGGVQPGRPEPALPSLLSDADAEEDRKDDSGDDSKEESAETLRARRAASAQRDAAKRKQLQAQRQTPQSVGSAAALDSDAAGDVVKEGSLSMPAVSVATQRRALLLSLIGGLLVLLVLGWMLLPAMEDALFTPVRTGGRGATRHSGVPLTAASSEAHRAAAQAARNTAAQQ